MRTTTDVGSLICVDTNTTRCIFPTPSKGNTGATTDAAAGTLDLIVLGILSRGAKHGSAIAGAEREQTGGELAIEDAALYQALHRLDRQGLVDAAWRPSENNRRARYYTLTPAGRRRLREETLNWRRYGRALEAVLQG